MSKQCSDQADRPKKMKAVYLPVGVEHLRCWCGDLCKVKESTDFSDKMGMKFRMSDAIPLFPLLTQDMISSILPTLT